MDRKTFQFDPQCSGHQYIEDLATAYWYSSLLFTAVELEVFNELDGEGLQFTELAARLQLEPRACLRFLNALSSIGLVFSDGEKFFNSRISSDLLIKGSPAYQGDSVLWRRELSTRWEILSGALKQGGRVHMADNDDNDLRGRFQRYALAMDAVAKGKAAELSAMFPSMPSGGRMLDVGSGGGAMSAAFLEKFPGLSATLVDMPEVLDTAKEMMDMAGLGERHNRISSNVLETWPFEADTFGMILLSNIVHAFSHDELQHLLSEAARCLRPDGIILVHDFFMEHKPQKAALFDLNMLINTYNGMVFKGSDVIRELESRGFSTTGLYPLTGDTAMIAASVEEGLIASLLLDNVGKLGAELLAYGFHDVREIAVADVVVTDWARERCQYGCDRFESAHCPPNSPTPDETRRVLADFKRAFILEGEPPTRAFQHLVLKAERTAFKAGFHKAFSYWSGPCTLCDECVTPCRNTKSARPSMEGAGMDVYETVRKAGFDLRPLRTKGDFVKYYALLLLE